LLKISYKNEEAAAQFYRTSSSGSSNISNGLSLWHNLSWTAFKR